MGDTNTCFMDIINKIDRVGTAGLLIGDDDDDDRDVCLDQLGAKTSK